MFHRIDVKLLLYTRTEVLTKLLWLASRLAPRYYIRMEVIFIDNNLAYYDTPKIVAVKSFAVQAPGAVSVFFV